METDRWRFPKLKIETSDVIRSMDEEDADELLQLLLISNGAIDNTLAVCVGELLVRLKSLDKKSNDKQLSVEMSVLLLDDSALSADGSWLLNLICLLFGRMDRMASSVS